VKNTSEILKEIKFIEGILIGYSKLDNTKNPIKHGFAVLNPHSLNQKEITIISLVSNEIRMNAFEDGYCVVMTGAGSVAYDPCHTNHYTKLKAGLYSFKQEFKKANIFCNLVEIPVTPTVKYPVLFVHF